jgi:hypothetical protein
LYSRCAELKCTCRVIDTTPASTRGAATFPERVADFLAADFVGMEGD